MACAGNGGPQDDSVSDVEPRDGLPGDSELQHDLRQDGGPQDDRAGDGELQDDVNSSMAAAHHESLPSRPDFKTALLALMREGVQFPQDILGSRCHELREFLAENDSCRDVIDLEDIYQFAKR